MTSFYIYENFKISCWCMHNKSSSSIFVFLRKIEGGLPVHAARWLQWLEEVPVPRFVHTTFWTDNIVKISLKLFQCQSPIICDNWIQFVLPTVDLGNICHMLANINDDKLHFHCFLCFNFSIYNVSYHISRDSFDICTSGLHWKYDKQLSIPRNQISEHIPNIGTMCLLLVFHWIFVQSVLVMKLVTIRSNLFLSFNFW